MKGHNTLQLNKETVEQAVEDYLNAQLTITHLKVKDVVQPGTEHFNVFVETIEEHEGTVAK